MLDQKMLRFGHVVQTLRMDLVCLSRAVIRRGGGGAWALAVSGPGQREGH